MGNIFQNIVAVTTVPSTPTPHMDDGGDLMLEATSKDNVAVTVSCLSCEASERMSRDGLWNGNARKDINGGLVCIM